MPELAADSLSTPSSSAIEASISPTFVPDSLYSSASSAGTFSEAYSIADSLAAIKLQGARTIALQFPDELLGDSVQVFREISAGLKELNFQEENQLGRKLDDKERRAAFVLADTTYGSCCVDSLAAMHINADFLIHYGHACLSKANDLATFYVFPHSPLSQSHLLSTLSSPCLLEGAGTLVMYDVGYSYLISDLEKEAKLDKELIWSKIYVNDFYEASIGTGTQATLAASSSASATSCCASLDQSNSQCSCSSNTDIHKNSCCQSSSNGSQCCGQPPRPLPSVSASTQSSSLRSYTLPSHIQLEDLTILYIGPSNSLALSNILLTHSKNTVYSYSPSSANLTPSLVLTSSQTNKMLMRRYVMMQKARDADVFGLLVGNVNLTGSLELLKKYRALLAKNFKKTYTISVGKINPAKLANFAEIECFVLIACPENSIVDSKEFYRPIITPFELELALEDTPDWTGKYILDFKKLLIDDTTSEEPVTEQSQELPEEFDQDDDNKPMFSTITGKYRHAVRYGDPSAGSTHHSQSLTLRSKDNQLAFNTTNSTDYLAKREWSGLDPRVGMDAPSKLEEGRAGIARGYEGN